MVSENNKKTVPATLELMLLVVGVASVIGIIIPNGASAQELLDSSETEQNGEGASGAKTADTTATLNDTITGEAGGRDAEPTACAPIQTDGGGQNATIAITDGATTGLNATSLTTAGGGNQSTSQVRDYIEETCVALQVGDTEAALMQLNLALRELGGGTQGNMTNATSVLTGGTTAGGGTFDDG